MDIGLGDGFSTEMAGREKGSTKQQIEFSRSWGIAQHRGNAEDSVQGLKPKSDLSERAVE